MKNKRVRISALFANLKLIRKIPRAMELANAIAAHKNIFKNPEPTPAAIKKAVEDLEKEIETGHSGNSNHRNDMHTKEYKLNTLISDLAHYVEKVADNDEEIVNLSTFQLRKVPTRKPSDFEVFLPDDPGAVGLKCSPKSKTVYSWQMCPGVYNANNFTEVQRTTVASTFVGGLESNAVYWFRVVLIQASGDKYSPAKGIVTL
ncbi:MAG: hypothetical protein HYX39_01105 [Bacteroidetes bacterium]|nr:hypothetical protein [Bacteroidota bacterium]